MGCLWNSEHSSARDIEFGANADDLVWPIALLLLRDATNISTNCCGATRKSAGAPAERLTVRSKAEDILSKLLPHGSHGIGSCAAARDDLANFVACGERVLHSRRYWTSCGPPLAGAIF